MIVINHTKDGKLITQKNKNTVTQEMKDTIDLLWSKFKNKLQY